MKIFFSIGILAVLLLQFSELKSQDRIIVRGKIVDASDQQPVIGATVTEYDDFRRIINGTITDVNGNYVLNASSADATIMVSYIGYKSQEFKLGSRTSVNIELESESIEIEEVAVVHVVENNPITNIAQRDMTSSRVKVDMSAFKSLGAVSAEENLQGQVAGLDIQSLSGGPGKGSSIVIRGLSSLGGAKPLIVVDGIPQDIKVDATFDFGSADQEDIGDLVNIAPQDIKSIEVLKDAALHLSGDPKVQMVYCLLKLTGAEREKLFLITNETDAQCQPPAIPMLNGDEYIMMQLEQLQNASGLFEVPPEIAYDKDFVDYYNYTANTDWVNAITQNGFINDQYLNISGGGEKTRFFTSVNYQKNNGTTINTSLTRLSTRVNLDYDVSQKIQFSTNFSYSNSVLKDNFVLRANLSDGARNVNIREMAYMKAPNMSIMEYDYLGQPTGEYFTPIYSYQGDGTDYFNPVAVGELSSNDVGENQMLTSFVLTYKITNWLRFRETISFQYLNAKGKDSCPTMPLGQTGWTGEKMRPQRQTPQTRRC